MIKSIQRADANAIGHLVDASQEDAERCLQNQVPETSFLAQSARDHGAVAASAFGAGFGGAVWALVQKNESPAFLKKWQETYARAYPEHNNATFFSDETGMAAQQN